MIYRLMICLLFLLCSCGSHNLEDYEEEGEGITRSLTQELKKIRNREQLIASSAKLKQLFDRLVNTMIAAETYIHSHPEIDRLPLTESNHELSDHLRAELNRIYELEGGRQIIEKCQNKALERLDAFVKKGTTYHSHS